METLCAALVGVNVDLFIRVMPSTANPVIVTVVFVEAEAVGLKVVPFIAVKKVVGVSLVEPQST